MNERAGSPLVLIVEDEVKLARLLADYLSASNFATRSLDTGGEVVATVKSLTPDLVLLDLMLPEKDGLTVCKELRSFSDVPIIMVTARVDEIDRLLGLELGADDYICKPFSPREVVARVKAVLRRTRRVDERTEGARLNIDEPTLEATLDGRALGLTPVEFRLLKTLAAQPRRIFSRSQLLERLYEDHRVVTDRTVDSHVKNLRRKIAAACGDEELVRSIYGVGYKLEL
ncbi:MAG: response regulator [Betaproteobacteria bacterium]|nr:MAG: response regulator [Betaproteobacteria bacterium]